MADDITTEIHNSVQEVNANQWNHVVTQSRFGSVFHRYGWINALERGTSLTPKHVVVSKKSNPVAVFPNFVDNLDLPSELLPPKIRKWFPAKRLVSTIPGYGGPLYTGNSQEYFDLMFKRIADAVEGDVIFHVLKTNSLEYARFGKPLVDRGYSSDLISCRIVLEIDAEWETLLDEMHKSRRRGIRRAGEQDARIECLTPTVETLRETYTAYEQNMRRIDGSVVPRRFFEELASNLSDRILISKAVVEGREVGRLVHLLDDEQSTVHYFFSAIEDEADYEFYPSELLHKHAIQWGQRNDYTRYDFGETAADYTDSLFHYKDQYGGKVVPTLQWEKGFAPMRWGLYRLGRMIYRRTELDQSVQRDAGQHS